ncbi:MAG TPA: ATP-binding protein [Thermoanaerobaculia bacterium]
MITVPVPASFDERTFDDVVGQALAGDDDKVLLDARRLRFADPYGMVGLLAIGTELRNRGRAPLLHLPDSTEVTSYLARMHFYEPAREIFELHGVAKKAQGGGSDVLLEITPIRSHDDVHSIVDRVQDRAGAILSKELHYPVAASVQFSVMLSEVCQNIIEHSESEGWVCAQRYDWKTRLGRKVVVIAVMDLGVGFRGSMASEHATRFAERWSDSAALQGAFLQGKSRFADPGRGQGLQQIRKQARKWNGQVTIRSGTARIADVAEWSDAQPLQERLPELPGAQIGIVLPARLPQDEQHNVFDQKKTTKRR